ncbi:HNH endonuclease signature motif containing protein [Arthrobacter zhaoxinii]|uniref:HNH endonuclease signature motif containing protein n=1 Tax=Arthrobacter zhaoxinii TaxID=2964616 RepID=UPI00210677B5|nr:HNH endonuclease signature motif containing protein [Arthrobacter zhaoxinii]MCQ2002228.1 HNH endonuclease [Arthrobacter zhaoxinii]
MDQLGNTERTTEDQQPEGVAGEADAPRTPCTLSVYKVDLDASEPAGGADDTAATLTDTAPDDASAPVSNSEPDAGAAPTESATAGAATDAGSPAEGYPDGFTGTLALQNLEAFDEQAVGQALSRVAHLLSWTQALEARLVNRMGELFRDDRCTPSERIEPGLAFSLAASECAAILKIPEVTGQRLLSEATSLCTSHTATLTGLEEGRFSYQHAQVVLDQCQNVPAGALPEFESDLLKAAEGQTRSQFSAKARRLRERKFPDTISKRHLTAFEQRKVTLDREEDGMSCLSAYLQAAEAHQIYTSLNNAARGEQAAGDGRTADQLRADILAQLLMGGLDPTLVSAETGRSSDVRKGTGGAGGVRGPGGDVGSVTGGGRGTGKTGAGGTGCDDGSVVPRAEIMVLINAETLFGADDQPAELHGYGPISAEAARRLARNAAGWTGLAQDPVTGEILGVGRRRKVPAGLRRWLRARDGTCRFPGCRVSTANADIDHTTDWAKGGPTDHGNLEHLCRRHHRFKTLGYWKASQLTPGVIEWTSPTGRVYRTEPFLALRPPDTAPDPRKDQARANQKQTDPEPAPPF